MRLNLGTVRKGIRETESTQGWYKAFWGRLRWGQQGLQRPSEARSNPLKHVVKKDEGPLKPKAVRNESVEQLSEPAEVLQKTAGWSLRAKPRGCLHPGEGGGFEQTGREPSFLKVETVTGAQAPFPHLQNCFTDRSSTVIPRSKGRSESLEIHPKAAIMKTIWSQNSEQMKQRGKRKKFPRKLPYSHCHTPPDVFFSDLSHHTYTHTYLLTITLLLANTVERAENRHQ